MRFCESVIIFCAILETFIRKLNHQRRHQSQDRCGHVDGVVVIQSFSHQPQCQFVAHAACLLVAGSPVLEPDLDGCDVKPEAVCELTSPVVTDVAAAVVLGTQLLQLVSAERCTMTASTVTDTGQSSTYPRSYTVSSSDILFNKITLAIITLAICTITLYITSL